MVRTDELVKFCMALDYYFIIAGTSATEGERIMKEICRYTFP